MASDCKANTELGFFVPFFWAIMKLKCLLWHYVDDENVTLAKKITVAFLSNGLKMTWNIVFIVVFS